MPLPTGGMTATQPAATLPTISLLSVGSWMQLLQALFDVSTADVTHRIWLGLSPIKTLKSGKFETVLADRPDMYGPFWLATTAVVAMTGAANIERIFIAAAPPDYSLMWTAAWFVYGSLLVVPLAVYGCSWLLTHNDPSAVSVNYAHLLTVYGYSNLALVPMALLCMLPFGLWQKLLLGVGFGHSSLFLFANLWRFSESLHQRLRLAVFGITIACQAATYLAFYHVFLS